MRKLLPMVVCLCLFASLMGCSSSSLDRKYNMGLVGNVMVSSEWEMSYEDADNGHVTFELKEPKGASVIISYDEEGGDSIQGELQTSKRLSPELYRSADLIETADKDGWIYEIYKISGYTEHGDYEMYVAYFQNGSKGVVADISCGDIDTLREVADSVQLY